MIFRRLGLLTFTLALGLLPAAALRAAPSAADQHRWERQYYGTMDGHNVLLFGDSATYAKLAFGDLDGDGAPDLLVGKRDGHIDRFRNIGRPGRPVWRLAEENLTAIVAPSQGQDKPPRTAPIAVGSDAAPALVDIDGDGDPDLFVGSGDGRLFFFRNIGNPVLPVFQLVSERFVGSAFGNDLAPFFADVNGDRAPDLVLGNGRGQVYLMENQGDSMRAAFCVRFPPPDALPDQAPPCRPVPRLLASVAPESNAVPALADWDRDGDLELFVGMSNGTMAYYRNDGTVFAPDWRLAQRRYLAIDSGGYLAPAFLDANGDGHPDIWLGNSTLFIILYTNKGTGKVNDVWKVTPNVLHVARFAPGLRRAVIASGDLDADKDPDLIVGGQSGRLTWVENVGTPTAPAWRVRAENLLGEVARQNTAPCLGDIDGDGKLDLLVGGHDGRIALMRNTGTPKSPRFVLENPSFQGIEVGSDSVPALVDIDGDGKLDLLVGNGRGYVIYFHNEGTRTVPDFRLVSTRFGGVAVAGNAVPAVFDWNGDKRPDLLVGSRQGKLLLALNGGESKDVALKPWARPAADLGRFGMQPFSAPHFADLNGDGLPDLLIGDGEGNVRLWWNRGAPPARTAGAAGKAGGTATTAGGAEGTGAAGAAGAAPTAPALAAKPETGAAQGPPATGLESLGTGAPAQPLDLSKALTAPQTAAGLTGTGAERGPLAPAYTLASNHFGDIRYKSRVVPAFGDVDGDGDLDLVVGVGSGQIVYYRNDGTSQAPKWNKVTDALIAESPGRFPSPLLYDLNGDGRLELLIGTEDGRVLLYKYVGNEGDVPKFVLVPDALGSVSVGRNAAPAVARLNGDNLDDLLVGNFTGHLYAYLRAGKAQSLNFKLSDRRYMNVDVGVSSTPFVGDMDRDGRADMLIGSDQGNVVNYVRSPTSARNPWGWSKGPDYLHGLKFPFGTTPRLADIDKDGDMDLFVGSEKGTIYFYRNDAVPPAGTGSAQ